ncbi:hypothetical protein Taro_033341 [Colocasia esculenta]|uniref:Uncharacterized protein n=1 Tax=Colocasia esculenta TaxID=4460 RepID=A0A843VNJ9_COLES|nr:hypothetical protein [Colocasia esculenta]
MIKSRFVVPPGSTVPHSPWYGRNCTIPYTTEIRFVLEVKSPKLLDYHAFHISNEGISLRDFFMKVGSHDFLYELQLESHQMKRTGTAPPRHVRVTPLG